MRRLALALLLALTLALSATGSAMSSGTERPYNALIGTVKDQVSKAYPQLAALLVNVTAVLVDRGPSPSFQNASTVRDYRTDGAQPQWATLYVGPPQGATSVTVSSHTSFTVGTMIDIGQGATEEHNRVTSMDFDGSGRGVIGLANPLQYTHNTAELVITATYSHPWFIPYGQGAVPQPNDPMVEIGNGVQPAVLGKLSRDADGQHFYANDSAFPGFATSGNNAHFAFGNQHIGPSSNDVSGTFTLQSDGLASIPIATPLLTLNFNAPYTLRQGWGPFVLIQQVDGNARLELYAPPGTAAHGNGLSVTISNRDVWPADTLARTYVYWIVG